MVARQKRVYGGYVPLLGPSWVLTTVAPRINNELPGSKQGLGATSIAWTLWPFGRKTRRKTTDHSVGHLTNQPTSPAKPGLLNITARHL